MAGNERQTAAKVLAALLLLQMTEGARTHGARSALDRGGSR
jgi:hypothetical protein